MALTKVTGQVINSTTDLSVGVATVGGGTSTGDLYVVGVSTLVGDLSLSGNVSIGGTLTYEDVTNVDSVGLITARKGISVSGGDVKVGSALTISQDGNLYTTGISTFGGDVLIDGDIKHIGDTNTSIKFPAADTVTVETGGSERIRVTSDGYFGVGQTPTTMVGVTLAAQVADGTDDGADWGAGGIFQLNASGTAAAGNEILLAGAHSGGLAQVASGIGFGRHNTSDWGTYLSFKTHASDTSNIDSVVERVRISAGGDVSIGGHSSNYAASPLEVRGTNAGGDVAIRVTNNSTTAGSQAGIIFTTTTADYTTAGIAYERGGSADALRFYVGQSSGGGGFTNATERVRIDSSGRVGISTENPQVMLDIVDTPVANSDRNGDDKLTIEHAGTTNINLISAANNSCFLLFSDDTRAQGYVKYDHNLDDLCLSASDDVWFRTNGTETFRVVGSNGYPQFAGASDIRLTLGSAGTAGNNDSNWVRGEGANFISNAASGYHHWEIGGAERMHLDTDGNLFLRSTASGSRYLVLNNTGDSGHTTSNNMNWVRGNATNVQYNTAGGFHAWEVSGSQKMIINANGTIGAASGSNIYNGSDERLKENMVQLTDGLVKINQIEPISFTWKESWDPDSSTQYGFGAHQVKSVDETLVEPFSNEDIELDGETIDDPLRVNEKFIIPLLVKAVQELSAKVAALESS